MARYVVMQNGTDSAGAEFIREGFSVPALIAPHLWLLFYRQWLAAAGVIGVMVLGALAAWRYNAPLLALAADLPISVYIALEGASVRIANLERLGWRDAAVVEADGLEEAEIRFFGTFPQNTNTAAPVMAITPGAMPSNAFAFPARS